MVLPPVNYINMRKITPVILLGLKKRMSKRIIYEKF